MPGDGSEGGGNAADNNQLLNGGGAAGQGGEKKEGEGQGAEKKEGQEQVLNGGEKKEGEGQGAEKKEGEKKPEGAPEKYEDFKLPEGVRADETALAGFKTVAKELNLTQEQAQKLVTLQAETVAKAQAQAQSDWKKIEDGWIASAKADKEIGGADFDKNVGLANRAIQTFAGENTAKFVEALKGTGLGNHPEMIRFLVNVAKGTGEDKLVGGEAKQAQGFDAKSLYKNSNMS
jgi:hypothetical protein